MRGDLDIVSLDQQISCVKRELAIRERVYPQWVESGKMPVESMGRELRGMRAVLKTLEGLRRPWDGTERRTNPSLDFTALPAAADASSGQPADQSAAPSP
jgi:hypothetical protein